MCQSFSHFSGFLHIFVLAKLATSSIRVNRLNRSLQHGWLAGRSVCFLGTVTIMRLDALFVQYSLRELGWKSFSKTGTTSHDPHRIKTAFNDHPCLPITIYHAREL